MKVMLMNSPKYMIICFVALLFFSTGQTSLAQAVDAPLADATEEALAREIMTGIRCLVCQNQSIEDSDADLAVDLRQIVREQVTAGKNKEDIHVFLIERYGDWILLDPPFKLRTFLLWFGPFVFLSIGGFAVYVSYRKKTNVADEPPENLPENLEAKVVKSGHGISAFHIALLVVGLLGLTIFLYASLGKPNLATKENALQTDVNAELDDIYGELEAFVKDNPDNLEALGRFADLNMTMGRYGVAANTYGALYSAQTEAGAEGGILPLVLQGEALVRQAQGAVTPAARLVFINVVADEPTHPAARYYLGLWFLQNQEPDRALNIWQLLKADSQETAPWMPMLNFQISQIENNSRTVTGGGVRSVQAIEDVANMSAEDQQEFIDSMVERLRARLETTPNDYAGWWRLARVEVQRGNLEAALLALEQAEIYAPPIKKGEISAEYMRLEQQLENER